MYEIIMRDRSGNETRVGYCTNEAEMNSIIKTQKQKYAAEFGKLAASHLKFNVCTVEDRPEV